MSGPAPLAGAGTPGRGAAVPSDGLLGATLCFLREHLKAHAGLRVDDERLGALKQALALRMAAVGDVDLASYCARLSAVGTSELDELLNEFTVGETYFFRVPAFFESLERRLLPELLAHKQRAGDRSLRIWSAACASGEEPYSVAICLLNSGLDLGAWQVEILATDVCQRALARARAGVYSSWAFRGVRPDDQTVRRHFVPEGANLRLGPAPRQLVELGSLNLATAPFPQPRSGGRWDMVFLRNVLMYMDPETVTQVIVKTDRALADHGLLFLGECESVPALAGRFEPRQLSGVFHHRKVSASAPAPQPPPSVSAASRAPVADLPQTTRGQAPLSSPAAARGTTASTPSTRAARLYQIALAQIEAEELAQASTSLEAALQLDPAHHAARLALARVSLQWGRFAQVRVCCRELLAVDPLCAEAHLVLGVASHHEGESADALEHLRRAIYLAPELAVAHFFLGEAHARLGEAAPAERAYQRALAGVARSTDAVLELGFERQTLLAALELRLRGARSRPQRTGEGQEEP